jgi:Zn-finger nucleic acid-binding protein
MLRLSKLKGVTMKCPACTDAPLVMSERQGVEIDYCPACRGIWLDRGELDKLLDRAVATAHASAATQTPAMPQHQPYGDGRYGRYGHGDRDGYKRKKSWLHDIFD